MPHSAHPSGRLPSPHSPDIHTSYHDRSDVHPPPCVHARTRPPVYDRLHSNCSQHPPVDRPTASFPPSSHARCHHPHLYSYPAHDHPHRDSYPSHAHAQLPDWVLSRQRSAPSEINKPGSHSTTEVDDAKGDDRFAVSALLLAAATSEIATESENDYKESKADESRGQIQFSVGDVGNAVLDQRSPGNEGYRDDHLDYLRREAHASDGSCPSSTLSVSSSGPSAGPLKKRMKLIDDEDGEVSSKDGSEVEENKSVAVVDVTNIAKTRSYEADRESGNKHQKSTNKSLLKTRESDGVVSSRIVILRAHFPYVLHRLLNNSDPIVQSALEWLPHGQGWRVLRWNALCSDVLPVHFKELCNDMLGSSENGGETISRPVDTSTSSQQAVETGTTSNVSDEQWADAFLWNVKAWGFKEYKTGVEKGSFRHQLFVREDPTLCKKMGTNPCVMSASDIGRSSSSDGMSWRTSRKVASAIFKPRACEELGVSTRERARCASIEKCHIPMGVVSHPSYLRVPALSTDTAASSFAETRACGLVKNMTCNRPPSEVYDPHLLTACFSETKDVTQTPRSSRSTHPQRPSEVSPNQQVTPQGECCYEPCANGQVQYTAVSANSESTEISPLVDEHTSGTFSQSNRFNHPSKAARLCSNRGRGVRRHSHRISSRTLPTKSEERRSNSHDDEASKQSFTVSQRGCRAGRSGNYNNTNSK